MKLSQKDDSLVSLSMLLGIVAIFASWLMFILPIPFECIIAVHIAAVVGMILGTKERERTGSSAGLTLCIVGELFALICSVIGIWILVKTPGIMDFCYHYVEDRGLNPNSAEFQKIYQSGQSHCMFTLIRTFHQMESFMDQYSILTPIIEIVIG